MDDPAPDAGPSSPSAGDCLAVGDRVMVGLTRTWGAIRFVGSTDFSSGRWVGVELDQAIGKNDGSVKGVRYFTCPPLHGLFVRSTALRKAGSLESDMPSDKIAGDMLSDKPVGTEKADPVPLEAPVQFEAWELPPPVPCTASVSAQCTASESARSSLEKADSSIVVPGGWRSAEITTIQLGKPGRSNLRRQGAASEASEEAPRYLGPASLEPPPPELEDPRRPSARLDTEVSVVEIEQESSVEDGESRTPRGDLQTRTVSPRTAASVQRELAEAMEDHDAERIRLLLPIATAGGVSEQELAAARHILDFAVQQSLFDQLEHVRECIMNLTTTVVELQGRIETVQSLAVAEARRVASEESTRILKSELAPGPGPEPPLLSPLEAEGQILEETASVDLLIERIGGRLEQSVWKGIEAHTEFVTQRSVSWLMAEFGHMVEELRTLRGATASAPVSPARAREESMGPQLATSNSYSQHPMPSEPGKGMCEGAMVVDALPSGSPVEGLLQLPSPCSGRPGSFGAPSASSAGSLGPRLGDFAAALRPPPPQHLRSYSFQSMPLAGRGPSAVPVPTVAHGMVLPLARPVGVGAEKIAVGVALGNASRAGPASCLEHAS